jgi:hypothetical protein
MPGLDLAAVRAVSPAALAAVQQFERAWSQNQGTRADLFDLVRLLHRAGCSTEAEYLLRSNLLVSEEDGRSLSVDDAGLDLYTELFGTARREEFAAAIGAFALQFPAPLTDGAGGGFFVGYYTTARSACLAKYRMQHEPCYVRFEHDHRTNLDAWLECLTAEDQLLALRWTNRVWEIIGTGVSTQVYDDVAAEPTVAPDPRRHLA